MCKFIDNSMHEKVTAVSVDTKVSLPNALIQLSYNFLDA